MLEISSVNNPTIKEIRKLLQKKYRKETGSYLIEGFHLVDEALKANQQYSYVLCSEKALYKYEDDTNTFLDDEKTILINQAICDRLSSTKSSQEIFMVLPINQPKEFSFSYGKWVLLDNVTDPGNVGTIIRTADALGFNGVVFSEENVDLYNPKVQRSMQGSQFHIPLIQASIMEVIASFKENDVPLYVSVLDKTAKPLTDFASISQLGLVIGNEAHGVSSEVVASADEKIYIPIKGKAESFNAAVAAGIMIYHFS